LKFRLAAEGIGWQPKTTGKSKIMDKPMGEGRPGNVDGKQDFMGSYQDNGFDLG
jgi:hypothetical protein